MSYILSCESTVDIPYDYINGRNIPVLFYQYEVDGQFYDDVMGRSQEEWDRFYGFINAGKIPTTSQINEYTYLEFFESLIKDNDKDLIHLCFGTGMTGAYNNAVLAAEELRDKYPDRKIIVIDTYCSSSGYGLMVDTAANLRDQGLSIDELEKWVYDNREHIHHQFYTEDLTYFKRTGRVSGPTGAIATILDICPIMRLDRTGHIIAYSKVRGRNRAIQTTLDEMEKHACGGKEYSGKCFISHSDRYEDALELKEKVRERFPNISGDIMICDIGTIITSHCGPGTLAVYFFGDKRPD